MNLIELNSMIAFCHDNNVFVTAEYFPSTKFIKGEKFEGNKWYIKVSHPFGDIIYNKPVADGYAINSEDNKEVYEAKIKTYLYFYKQLKDDKY